MEGGDSTDAASMSAKIARLTGVVRRLHAACERGERERERAVEAFARDVALTRSEASCAVLRETAARERAEEETRASAAAGGGERGEGARVRRGDGDARRDGAKGGGGDDAEGV